eukprot:gene5105-19082_t
MEVDIVKYVLEGRCRVDDVIEWLTTVATPLPKGIASGSGENDTGMGPVVVPTTADEVVQLKRAFPGTVVGILCDDVAALLDPPQPSQPQPQPPILRTTSSPPSQNSQRRDVNGTGGGGDRNANGSRGGKLGLLKPTNLQFGAAPAHEPPLISPSVTAGDGIAGGASRNGPRGAFAVSLDNDSAFPKLGQASAGEYNTVKWNNQRTTAVAALFQPAAMIAAQNDFKATIEASSPRRQPSQPPGFEGRRGSGGGVFGEAAQPPAEPPVLKPKAKRRISPRLVEHGPAHHAARNMPFSTATAAAAPNGIGGGSSDGNAGGVETSAFQRANLSSSAITTTAAAATIGISTSVSAVSTTVTTTPPTSPQPQPKALSNGSAAASASVSAPSSSGCNASAAAVVPLPGLGSGSDGEDQDLKIALFAELVGRLAQGRLFLAVSAVLHTMARLLKLKVEEKSTHSTSIACQLASSGSGAAAAFCQYRPVVLHTKRQACLLAHALSEKWGMNELVSTVASPPHSHRRQMPLKLTPSKPLRSSARVTSYPSASNAARVTTSSTATASASAAPSIPDAASVSEAAAIAVDAVILREGDALTRHERETRQKQQEKVFTSFNTMASRFSYHAKA